VPPLHPRCNPLHSKQRKKRMRSLHQVGFQSTPPSSTTRRCHSSSRAFAKSSSKGGGRTTSPAPKGCGTGVVSPVISLQNVHIQVKVTGTTTRRGRRKWKRRSTTRRRAARHTWGVNGTPTRASLTPPPTRTPPSSPVNKGILFPNVGHKCLMAKDGKKKKVHSRATPKYTTSSDEGSSSDDEDDLISLFANLNMEQKKK
jgi:hypothetical protein